MEEEQRTSGGLVEPLATFAAATAAASALFWTSPAVPFLRANLHGAIAVVFLYAPALAARLSRRPFDYRAAGLRLAPVGLGLRTVGLAIALFWPVFLAGFFAYYGLLCSPTAPPALKQLAALVAPICARWHGLAGASFHLPSDFALLALSQVVVVALPEELFFRGYLYSRLEARWPSTRRFAGAQVGPALVATSALFAVGHFLVDFDPLRLVVFFPALAFGWMRARTGSVAPGALFHALCNLLSEALYASFFF